MKGTYGDFRKYISPIFEGIPSVPRQTVGRHISAKPAWTVRVLFSGRFASHRFVSIRGLQLGGMVIVLGVTVPR